MSKVSVIIPSRNERFLNNTINDVLAKSTGEIEVMPVLDGYTIPYERIDDPRVKYIVLPGSVDAQKRIGINTAVQLATGEYVMWLDAHCMVGEGFDEILARDCEDNWVVIPRRYKLEPESWTVRPDVAPIDYEYWMFREFIKGVLKPYRWDRPERADKPIDDTLTCQASCFFMRKSYFNKMGWMKLEGYTAWGQEDVEICLETWLDGGRVVTNKNTWYAHLFKGKTYGRMYLLPRTQWWESRDWAYDYWVKKNTDKFAQVIEKFMPIPNWVPNWRDYICNKPQH